MYWGKGSIEREILAGTEVTISATPAEGFEFHEWSSGWNIKSNNF